MIEKVGHSKRMALMRKEWIDEGKPGYARDKALRKQDEESREKSGGENAETGKSSEGDREESNAMFFADSTKGKDETNDAAPEDDELDALLREQDAASAPSIPKQDASTESEGEDDLDALLAEQETRKKPPPTAATSSRREDEDEDEDDDLEALLAEQAARDGPQPAIVSRPRNTIFDEDDDNDHDLDALLSEQKSRNERLLPAAPASPSKETAKAGDIPGDAPRDAGVEQTGEMLSSPLPNNPEEEDLADFLSSPIPNDE